MYQTKTNNIYIGEFGLLQIVSDADTRQCANEDDELQGGELWDPILVEAENETFLIRVWKPLPSTRNREVDNT